MGRPDMKMLHNNVQGRTSMRFRLLIVPIVALALVAAACGSDDKNDNSSSSSSSGGGGKNKGKVSLFSAMEPEEATALQAVLDDLVNSKTDYKATVEASSSFEEQA